MKHWVVAFEWPIWCSPIAFSLHLLSELALLTPLQNLMLPLQPLRSINSLMTASISLKTILTHINSLLLCLTRNTSILLSPCLAPKPKYQKWEYWPQWQIMHCALVCGWLSYLRGGLEKSLKAQDKRNRGGTDSIFWLIYLHDTGGLIYCKYWPNG